MPSSEVEGSGIVDFTGPRGTVLGEGVEFFVNLRRLTGALTVLNLNTRRVLESTRGVREIVEVDAASLETLRRAATPGTAGETNGAS